MGSRRAMNAARILSLSCGLGGDDPAQEIRRNPKHLTGLGDSADHEHPHPGEQVQLAEERPGPWVVISRSSSVVHDDVDGA